MLATLKSRIRPALGLLRRYGFDVQLFCAEVRGRRWYRDDRSRFSKMLATSVDRASFNFDPRFPYVRDRRSSAGTASGHYFHQDLLVAQMIFRASPQRHIDVGSRVDGFVAHVASFRSIEVMDIRPMLTTSPNITFVQGDLLHRGDEWNQSADSLSCLHALEHLGLGRYGDPLDPDAWRAGLISLTKMLQPGGILYLSVPIGPQRIEFNAHRVFSVAFVNGAFPDDLDIVSFHYVDDRGDLHLNADWTDASTAGNSYGCTYGCGIWELRRQA